MNTDLLRQLVNVGFTLCVGLLVWRYYRRRKYPLTKRYSTFGPRFWTGSVDACVLSPITFIATALLLLNIPKIAAIATALLLLNIPKIAAALVVVLENLGWLIYTVVMHALHGQTVGKMVTKVRVVDFRTERSISWRQAWLREGIPIFLSLGILGYEVHSILTGRVSPSSLANGEELIGSKAFWLLSALPALWFLAEVVTMLTNEKRRALDDLIAGTVVVRTNIEEGSAQPDAAS